MRTCEVHGTHYDTSMTVVIDLDFDNKLPILGEIQFFIIDTKNPNQLYFLGKTFLTSGFYERYHAYEKVRSDEWFFIAQNKLISFYPSHVRSRINKKLYVTHRHVF